MPEISFVPDAADDYLQLDGAVRLEVRKAIEKLKVDPRGYGEPLGNKAGIDLFGFFSIRAGKRIRLIYSVGDADQVVIRVIGKRERFAVHKTAEERIASLRDLTKTELVRLQELLEGEDAAL